MLVIKYPITLKVGENSSPSVSDPDPDPCGSVLKRLPWLRIRIGNADPDPGQSK